jgi:hypothetical protein
MKGYRSSASVPRVNFNFVPVKPITCTGIRLHSAILLATQGEKILS